MVAPTDMDWYRLDEWLSGLDSLASWDEVVRNVAHGSLLGV